MIERDASANVTLHDQHADIIRRAVTDPKYIGEIDWSDNTIEVVGTAVQALDGAYSGSFSGS